MPTDLKPKDCPYCGPAGDPRVSPRTQSHWVVTSQVVCQRCSMAGPENIDEDESVLLWNEVEFHA